MAASDATIIAREGQLNRQSRFAGFFLIVWGAGFGGIPLLIGIFDPREFEPILLLFVLLGMGGLLAGVCIICRRHKLRLFTGRGLIEETTGFVRENRRFYHPLDGFHRLVIASTHGNNSIVYRLSLRGAGSDDTQILDIGTYGNINKALDNAIHVARLANLEIEDRVSGEHTRHICAADLRSIPARRESNTYALDRLPVKALIGANLVPVAGVMFAGWQLLPVMLLFWMENVIVGFYNVLKMVMVPGQPAAKILTVPFFVVHYGGFCAGHAFFVVTLFTASGSGPGTARFASAMPALQDPHMWLAILALVLSHGVSFVKNYIDEDEYRRETVAKLMAAPYARVVVLHVIILAGGFILLKMESPAVFLVLLVVLKTAIDVYSHVREHRRFSLGAYDDLATSA